jgi:hypothetical protein
MNETQGAARRIVLIAAVIVLALGGAVALAVADDSASDRLERKVRVMERVFDEVLVQSPNVMAGPGRVTRGLVLQGYGALFTFDANLGTEYFMGMSAVEMPREPGEPIVIQRMPRSERDEGWEPAESWEEIKAEAENKRKEKYAAFKTEIIDALIDYGATLSELADDRWVAVATFIDSRSPFDGGGGGRLLIKIKMRDLRQYSSGSLSREAAAKRVVIEES